MAGKRKQDLTVKGESIEQVYRSYRDRRYLVNRRYQRKLVWTVEEKQRFIDSIAHGFPVPIILLAEASRGGRSYHEIIDGMQRLDAITSFIENVYALHVDDNAFFFDLNTMASTKALLDEGVLAQREPVLDRSLCVTIASYTLPLSVYEFAEDGQVDEVFRRINSGGRQLSRQELRMAGSIGPFTAAVRITASRLRGDSSTSDELALNDMARISLSNRDLKYGIPVDDVFWVKHSILTKEQVRESRDEELIADILAYVLISPKPSSRSEYLDDYFGLGRSEVSEKRRSDLELEVQKRTIEVVAADFQRVIDELLSVLGHAQCSFGELLFGQPPQRAPRYFQVVFLALYHLLVEKNMRIASRDGAADALRNAGGDIKIQEGGRWGAESRSRAVDSMVGVLQRSFEEAHNNDPAVARWVLQFENLLTNSFTEQPCYDFKQGFLRLDKNAKIDQASISKVLETLVGIANIGPRATGYVIIGVTDKSADAMRIQQLYGVSSTVYRGFHVVGIEHEAQACGRNLDQHFQWLADQVVKSDISEPLRSHVRNHMRLIRYYDKAVIVLESKAQKHPSHMAGRYFDRSGAQLSEILPADLATLFERFS
ncbi:GmrSD restriction endonuclease domain-containing protein [Paraliomyxa miuraensis]|uniref:GmrSD restriction endonuclease domain-containing protein n=1 Tax=Paraliomyxa miuraensis TaxID=376150 RepID=UPI00225536B5|nr:DUF262 domain-containing protein [Paraliomyxa miuraensis]MCX4239926.1 DUF262 domain-containing protein [Paraliomyxa miuraensis]